MRFAALPPYPLNMQFRDFTVLKPLNPPFGALIFGVPVAQVAAEPSLQLFVCMSDPLAFSVQKIFEACLLTTTTRLDQL